MQCLIPAGSQVASDEGRVRYLKQLIRQLPNLELLRGLTNGGESHPALNELAEG
jgi:hypothetical protein